MPRSNISPSDGEQARILDFLARTCVDVDTLGPHHVVCNACDHKIGLGPKKRYNIANWEWHEKTCKGVQKAMSFGTAWKPQVRDRTTLLMMEDLSRLWQEQVQRLGLHNPDFRAVDMELKRLGEKPRKIQMAGNPPRPVAMAFQTHTTAQRTRSPGVMAPSPGASLGECQQLHQYSSPPVM
ncbi:hypothetical protein Moror_5571 [Moniliophthora roreri MCA 2997]|uniref:Uncharacterized protein n=1 Tax=Moniliophthora roreri (strain MCA 2997) TaxID=1381753 RepID=V2X6S7_MONRO|nr:hypothetical protein Moror_5571 [Moniliophthora roreri MCA 2997]